MTTYVEVIDEIKILIGINQEFANGLAPTAVDLRYSLEYRETARVLAEFSTLQVGRLKTLASSVAALGMANSNEPFDKILEALEK